MAAFPVIPKLALRAKILLVVAVLLLIGSAGFGCHSLSCFFKAQGQRSEFASRIKARSKPGNPAASVEMMFGLLGGGGPYSMDIAAASAISEQEKDAWRSLCFTLILGVSGFHLGRYALRGRSITLKPALPGIDADI